MRSSRLVALCSLSWVTAAAGLGLHSPGLTLRQALEALARQDATLQYVTMPPGEAVVPLDVAGPADELLPRVAAAFGCQAYWHCGIWVIAQAPGFEESPRLWQAALRPDRAMLFADAREIDAMGDEAAEELVLTGGERADHLWAALADWHREHVRTAEENRGALVRLPHHSEPGHLLAEWMALRAANQYSDGPLPVPPSLHLTTAMLRQNPPSTHLVVRFAMGDYEVTQDLGPVTVHRAGPQAPSAYELRQAWRPRALTDDVLPSARPRILSQSISASVNGKLGVVAATLLPARGPALQATEELAGAEVALRFSDTPVWLSFDCLSIASGAWYRPGADCLAYELRRYPEESAWHAFAALPLEVRAASLAAKRNDYQLLTELGALLWRGLGERRQAELAAGAELPAAQLEAPLRQLAGQPFHYWIAGVAYPTLAAFDGVTSDDWEAWVYCRGGVRAVRCRMAYERATFRTLVAYAPGTAAVQAKELRNLLAGELGYGRLRAVRRFYGDRAQTGSRSGRNEPGGRLLMAPLGSER